MHFQQWIIDALVVVEGFGFDRNIFVHFKLLFNLAKWLNTMLVHVHPFIDMVLENPPFYHKVIQFMVEQQLLLLQFVLLCD